MTPGGVAHALGSQTRSSIRGPQAEVHEEFVLDRVLDEFSAMASTVQGSA